jgi:hypothetical protein
MNFDTLNLDARLRVLTDAGYDHPAAGRSRRRWKAAT